jgi:hypothetical protein
MGRRLVGGSAAFQEVGRWCDPPGCEAIRVQRHQDCPTTCGQKIRSRVLDVLEQYVRCDGWSIEHTINETRPCALTSWPRDHGCVLLRIERDDTMANDVHTLVHCPASAEWITGRAFEIANARLPIGTRARKRNGGLSRKRRTPGPNRHRMRTTRWRKTSR